MNFLGRRRLLIRPASALRVYSQAGRVGSVPGPLIDPIAVQNIGTPP